MGMLMKQWTWSICHLFGKSCPRQVEDFRTTEACSMNRRCWLPSIYWVIFFFLVKGWFIVRDIGCFIKQPRVKLIHMSLILVNLALMWVANKCDKYAITSLYKGTISCSSILLSAFLVRFILKLCKCGGMGSPWWAPSCPAPWIFCLLLFMFLFHHPFIIVFLSLEVLFTLSSIKQWRNSKWDTDFSSVSFYFTGARHRDIGTVCMSDSRAGVEILEKQILSIWECYHVTCIQIMNCQSVFLESTCRVNKYLAKKPTAVWC